jgi:AP-1 complex subunit beta-1
MHTKGMVYFYSRKGGRADSERRKDAIQRTIMAMTLGKDVSALFPDVLKNIATGDLDQKKLVYLYLM